MAAGAALVLGGVVVAAVTWESGSGSAIVATALTLVGFGALVVPLVWVVRTVPGVVLTSVVRQRFLLGLRLAFVALAVLLGVVTAVVGANPVSDVAGTLLLFGVFGLTVLGFVTGS